MKNFAVCLALALFSVANAIEYHNETSSSEMDIEEIDSLSRQFREYMSVEINGNPSSKRTRVKRTAGDDLFDIRQNTDLTVFETIDAQIKKEYRAMYFYEALAANFKHPNVGKRGFSKMFKNMADEELEHARKLIQYVSDRGMPLTSSFGEIKPYTGTLPNKNVTKAITAALKKEKEINQSLLDLHKKADTAGDPHLQDFLETHYLDEQVKSIRDLRIMLSRLANSDNQKDIVFLMDQELLRG